STGWSIAAPATARARSRCGPPGWPARPAPPRSRSPVPAAPISSVRWRRRRNRSRPCPHAEGRHTVTAPEADLSGWSVAPFTGGGYTHDVYRKGTGPGVVLIPEIPGIHPGVLGLGNHLVDNGFTVAMPSLFGEPGRPESVGYTAAIIARACVARE